MQQLTLVALSLFMLGFAVPASAKTPPTLQCAGFSPYIGSLNPDYGPAPSPELIGQLLDQLIKHTPYRCIMTYGVLNGLEAIFPIAKAKKLQVIAIIWLDNDPAANSRSIAKGIETAKAFPDTIIKLSCGSELRTRHGFTYDGEIYTLRPGAEPVKVSVAIRADGRSTQERIVPVNDGFTEMRLSSNGKEYAYVFHGEVFVSSIDGGFTKRITNTPYQERSVSFSPDGRSLVYAAEVNNSWNVINIIVSF